MAPRILALDPGLTTGWACINAQGVFSAGQTNFDETVEMLRTFVAGLGEIHIVSESFMITKETAKNTQSPWSLELIGVARMFSHLYADEELTLQSPAAAKRFSSDSRLKLMGWYTPGKGHANDAARHLLLYMATRGHFDNETLATLTTEVH